MEVLNSKKQLGFTLIELMVAMTIFSIVALFVVDIYMETSKSYFNSLSNRSAQQNVKIAMETITRYVKQSSRADWDGSILSLQVKDDDGNPYPVIFQKVGSSIDMSVNGLPLQALTSDDLPITNFSVNYYAGVPTIVNITIIADITEKDNRSKERGIAGDDMIKMTTSTALKAQYNY
ncbi:prepilin-type N-terminal cleavage/methylation domain-containing protein [bacterium]|nr:prepilin-type N-terminal cleavage/methylation domain-containing protein [bacterium]